MRIEISTYLSTPDDLMNENLQAIVYHNTDTGMYEVDYMKDGKVITTESYENHNLAYHENSAEDYVLGVKVIKAP